MKLEKIVKSAFDKLNRSKIKSALLDSELLLSKAINKSREFIVLNNSYDIEKKDYLYFQQMPLEDLTPVPQSFLVLM